MISRKILVMGLPGSGKTTFAKALARDLGAVHFNADAVRADLHKDLGFSPEDRVEHARRMGWMCDRVVESGGFAVADFVCPTRDCRRVFGAGSPACVVWVRNLLMESIHPDTTALFEPPFQEADYIVTRDGATEALSKVLQDIRSTAWRRSFDPQAPTALFVGRYQPFHDGHRALVLEGIRRVGQACIAVRNMPPGSSNPFTFQQIKARIEEVMADQAGRFVVQQVPNVAAVFYGRDVGYSVERITLSDELEAISATEIRSGAAGAQTTPPSSRFYS